MPQSTKDSKGGKTHAAKSKSRNGGVSEKAVAKKSAKSTGPTGPLKKGEKKSTPH